MSRRRTMVAALLSCLIIVGSAVADEVRYYTQDGVTYRETTRRVRRPVTETRVQPQPRTTYRQQYSTQVRQTQRAVYMPVTRYAWVGRWYGRWNPFQDPYFVYELEPMTYWQSRVETVRLPVTQRRLIPETKMVQVPVTVLRFEEKDEFSRVAVAPRRVAASRDSNPTLPVKSPGPIGGIARLDGDPPRYATGLVTGDWRVRR